MNDNGMDESNQPAPPPALAHPRRSGLRTALIATSAVVALAAGASAYSLGTYLSGGGTQPDDVLRSGAIAFAKVDLDPAANQKLAIYQLSKKFPALLQHAGSADAFRDALLAKVFTDPGSGMTYEADVKPWLGDRAAVAVYPSAEEGKAPRFAIAVQYTDEATMLASMKKDLAAEDGFDWATRDGYVVMTEHAEADDLVAGNGAEALTAQPNLASDVAALEGDQLAVVWADLGRLADLAAGAAGTAMASLGGGAGAGVPDGLPPELAAQVSQQIGDAQKLLSTQLARMADVEGRLAMGLRAGGDYLEMQGKMFGAGDSGALTGRVPGTGLAGAMPADSVAALSVSGMSAALAEQWKSLAGLTPMVEGMLSGYGLELPADIAALFGDETAVALGGGTTAAEPHVAVRTRGGDADRAAELVALLTTALGLDPVVTEKIADGFVVGNNAAQAKAAAGEGARLGDTDSFKRAVPDAGRAALVLYADIARALEDDRLGSSAEAKQAEAMKAEALDAVGFTATAAEDPEFRLRLTTR